jgi:2-C-methyl-D-erythritol 2,4-cyclodiphosphate synthase
MSRLRIGTGVDVHAFTAGDAVYLGGVRVPHTHGVLAHSDGDVLLHALCDALFGAAGLGDIGQHFPDSEPRYKGIASLELLGLTLNRVREQGFDLVNIDLTLLAESPRLGPFRDAIRASIAQAVGLPVSCVNIKATTTEKLGFLGRGEGIAAHAAVLLELRV